MSEQSELKAEISGEVKVGPSPQPSNQFKLSIKNLGEEIKITPKKCFRLKGKLGSGPEALFLNKSDARKCITELSSKFKVDWDFSNSDCKIFCLKIYAFDESLQKNELLKFLFSKVISKTAPDGPAILSFETGFSDSKQKLLISKVADKPGIISFYSDPPEGVKNLPGEDVTLKWHTYKLNNRELTQIGIADPLSYDFSESKDEGSKTITNVSTDMTFRLRGYDGPKPIDREIRVDVLKTGWYDLQNTLLEGDPGYPDTENIKDETEAEKSNKRFCLEPTLLFNVNNVCLYGIFRHKFVGMERAFLFQTENPFGEWKLIKGNETGKGLPVPKGFSTSPGVYFDDKLWLIGGSQIDQEKTSIGVCWINCKNPSNWKELELKSSDNGPQKRMGHAVLVFQNKIWVMGGRDYAGNALKDVWALDVTIGDVITGEWSHLGEAPWDARCLINPVVFDNKIWLYGGAKEPSSVELYDDLYTCTYADERAKWEELKFTGVISGKEGVISEHETIKPIGSCMQVFKNKLHLFGKFRTEYKDDGSRLDEPLGFILSDPDTITWERFPTEGLKKWGAAATFSYQSVNFQDRMLISRALGRDIEEAPVLKVYVP